MLTKPMYEILPVSYMTIGVTSLLMFDQDYAIASALVMFTLGAKIYNMRSQNRRTDPLKKRKSGTLPSSIYDASPFIYLLLATLVFKMSPSGIGPVIGISLMTYSLYILVRRASNRRHRLHASQEFNQY
ncbi:hypothetical protein [Shewanella violacea]|uniref:Uncharacterized protein n=1 Tax=Shewanella violacea (strain JCM 10179 / CIP 106290 / LMG 19151 / DSS12) TaxID=637905 RepID=D4ZGZ4_SHEVD|nr:hypothetical protein [Shewanella violacea]BAJ00943.1 conserved hypothetical protein [Shewanella violacea DSS12]